MPPSGLALSAFDKLGKQIDEQIKDSLVVQLSGIKGTELMCTALCLLMSLLPCKTSNAIVDAIDYIKQLQSNVNSAIGSAVNAEKSALASINGGLSGGVTGLANVNDIKSSVNAALGKGPKTNDPIQNTVNVIKSTISTLATVVQVLNLLVSVIRLAYNDPWSILGWLLNGVFDLLENVLLALQAMAVQMADSIMNKVIAPLEKYLNDNTFPALCGLSAQLLFRKLLQMIYNFKKKILEFIKDLFSFQKRQKTKFKLFNENLLLTLELSAFLKIFQLLLNNFLDIAIACGVQRRPCPEWQPTSNSLSQNYTGQYRDDQPVAVINSNFTDPTPLPNNLNDISIKIQPMIDSIFPGAGSIVTPGMITTKLTNLPPLIQALLTNVPLSPDFSI
jgi:hypothetical protein